MTVRLLQGMIVEDRRRFFSFTVPGGRQAGTKAMTAEEARKIVAETLQLKLKEVV